MPTTQTILTVLHLFLSIGLIGLVLIQHGRGADAGAAFGSGASATVFGARGSGSFLSRATAILATLFFVTSMALAYFAAQVGEPQGLMEGVEVPVSPTSVRREVPAVPEPVGGGIRTEVPAVPGIPAPAAAGAPSEVPSLPGAAVPVGGAPQAVAPTVPAVPVLVETASDVSAEAASPAPEVGRSDEVTAPQEGRQTDAQSGGN